MKLNLRFTDPCKKCLVRAACNKQCDEYPKYIKRVIHRTKLIPVIGTSFLALALSFIMTIITTDKIPVIAPLSLISILVLLSIGVIIAEVIE